jgi:hypothetical protein
MHGVRGGPRRGIAPPSTQAGIAAVRTGPRARTKRCLCVNPEWRSRRPRRFPTARDRPKSRFPATARGVRRHGRCAGQLLHLPGHARSGRHGRPTAPGNRRKIHQQSRFGRRLLRGQTGCFRNGRGWSERPCSSFRRTAPQFQTEWNKGLRKRQSERWRRYDCRSWESSIMTSSSSVRCITRMSDGFSRTRPLRRRLGDNSERWIRSSSASAVAPKLWRRRTAYPEVLETARDASKPTAKVACCRELYFGRLPQAVGSG